MDDINIASTIQGQYNGLAQQADARARAGYYNSLSDINRQNMPIQAQDAANRNAAYQQSLQSGQMDLDEKKQQQADSQFAANAFMKNHSTTTDALAQTPSAPITSAGPVKPQPQPQVQAPGLSSLLNPNALTANQSQVMQGQNPTPPPASGMATPASGTLKSPFPPVSEADLLGHLKGAVQTSASQNPMVEGISSTMAKIPNGSDTTSAVGDNPHFAATHTFDSVNPTTGKITHNTFNRQGYLDELASNPRTAGLVTQLESQWTAQDAGDQLTKAQSQVAKTSQLLGMVSSVANAAPEHQQAAFNFMLQQAEKQGLDVSSLKGTDLSTPEGQAKLDYLNKAAQADAATGAANLAVAKNTTDRLKANSEIGLQGAQASEIPSKIGLNRAEAGKASAEAAKARSETIAPTAPSGSYPLNPNINPKDAKTAPNDMTLAPQNRGIDLTRVPTEQQGIIKSLVNGDLLLTDIPSRSSTGATKLQIERWLTDAAPNYSAPQMELQKKALGTFASKNGDNINSLNALSEHLQLARYLAPALNNGDVTAWNQLGNSLGEQFGKDNKTNFETLTGVLGGETDKFMSGNNPTQTGSAEWQKRLKSSGSPTQIEGTLQTLEKAVGGKFSGIAQAYKQATGGRRYLTDQDTNFLTPQASALMQKYEPGAGRPSTPQPAASQPPANYNKQQAIQDAKAAIAAGAPRDAVLARSKSIGHDLTGAF